MTIRPTPGRVIVLVLTAAAVSCTTFFVVVPKELAFSSVNDFLHQRGNIDLSEIGRSRYDLVIIDYSRDGGDQGAWTASEIAALKTAGEGRFVLAGLSVGEGESFRTYWDTLWQTGSPDWVGREVPLRPDNYKVKYWDPEWKEILKSRLSRIGSQGFDGVYLEGVDAYKYWGGEALENLENEELSPEEAADRMADLVREIAEYCRTILGKDRFIVCPHNGASLRLDASPAKRDTYLREIDAVGADEVFYSGDSTMDNPYGPREETISDLIFFLGQGKAVLVTEYLSRTNTADIARFYTEARGKGFIPFAADRDLGSLRINTGNEPD